jgi:hypothetical protein
MGSSSAQEIRHRRRDQPVFPAAANQAFRASELWPGMDRSASAALPSAGATTPGFGRGTPKIDAATST